MCNSKGTFTPRIRKEGKQKNEVLMWMQFKGDFYTRDKEKQETEK
jgi:hypothetical protein